MRDVHTYARELALAQGEAGNVNILLISISLNRHQKHGMSLAGLRTKPKARNIHSIHCHPIDLGPPNDHANVNNCSTLVIR